MTLPSLVTNLPGQPRMLDVVRRELAQARRVDIAVSFVRHSGLALLRDALLAFLERGGEARILTSTYMQITQPDALRALQHLSHHHALQCRVHAASLFPQLAVASDGFHAKIYLFQNIENIENIGHSGWIGSSNISSGGLCTSVEANLRATSGEAAQIATLFERLWQRDDVLPLEAVLSPYAHAYAAALSRHAAPAPILTPPQLPELPPTVRPNEAQREALARLRELRQRGERRAVIVAAPGIGKTFLAAFDASAYDAHSVLFLSHRREHLRQAERTFARVFPATMSRGLLDGEQRELDAALLFATVQSARNHSALRDRHFDYVVIDEFHHAEAPSYVKLLETLRFDFLLGLTATPERADGRDVLKLCDYNVAYEVRLVEGIARGWLLPFHYFAVSDALVDYAQIPWRSGRFDPDALEAALMIQDRVSQILEHAAARGFDGLARATVGFCAGVRHARYMAEEVARQLGDARVAAALTGSDTMARREAVYAQLQDPNHPLEWLFVSDLLNEGVDLPGINSLLFLRPTESASLFIQQLGRGLRRAPGCEVLTVLDFVGHHKKAWLVLEALHDARAPRGPSTVEALDLTPPPHCEIVLDEKTIELMEKLRAQAKSSTQRFDELYVQLCEELGADPWPLDLWDREDMPELPSWRTSKRPSWLDYRRAHDMLDTWEEPLDDQHIAYSFLAALERNWQQQRVYAYALLWALCGDEGQPLTQRYDAFFTRFPRWSVEHKPLEKTSAWKTLRETKLDGAYFDGEQLHPDLIAAFPSREVLREQVMCRIGYWLNTDHRMRHGGVLRTPDELTLHRGYARHELIPYFGRQYDPALDNKGIIVFSDAGRGCEEVVILTRVEQTQSKAQYHYENGFSDASHLRWQSQNSQRRDSGSGERLVNHAKHGVRLQVFVQPSKGEAFIYCGEAQVERAKGDQPIDVVLRLDVPLSPALEARFV